MPLQRTWLRTLIGGAAIYALVTGAAESTENIHLLPVVLLLGALLVPVTFVVYLFERLGVDPAVLPALTVCFWAGGSVGVAAAGFLEYETLRDLGALPMLAVGVIEESVKLAVPLWLLARGRFRSPGDGLLFGVASGMGFAALETMGYGLVALIQSGGRIGPAAAVLLIRGLISPVGHAALDRSRLRGAVAASTVVAADGGHVRGSRRPAYALGHAGRHARSRGDRDAQRRAAGGGDPPGAARDHAAGGSVTRTVVPTPGALATSRLPPADSARCSLDARPM